MFLEQGANPDIPPRLSKAMYWKEIVDFDVMTKTFCHIISVIRDHSCSDICYIRILTQPFITGPSIVSADSKCQPHVIIVIPW